MKSTIGILDMLFKSLAGAVLSLVLVVGAAYAADATGCDDPNNDMINGDFALCSVHAYNIWETENNPENVDFMREVVAMKTTLITQQMYKQYEQIDSMVTRLKTQLEKAVLKTKFQFAGASSDDDEGSSGKTAKRYGVKYADAKDCDTQYSIEDALDCYKANTTLIASASGNGNNLTRDLKEQLVSDLRGLGTLNAGGESTSTSPCKEHGSENETYEKCIEKDGKMKKNEFLACLKVMQQCLRTQTTIFNNKQAELGRSKSNNWRN